MEKAMTRKTVSISRKRAEGEMRATALNRSVCSREVSLVPIKQHQAISSREVSLVPIKQVYRRATTPRVRVLLIGCALVLLALLVVNAISYTRGAMAQRACARGDQRYSVVSGDTLSNIASRYGTSWMALASYNQLADPSFILPGEIICIPTSATTTMTTSSSLTLSSAATIARANLFPYGQCTWWANERYAQLHNGAYVPWTWNSHAWQWTARAYDFHWQVSDKPSVGDIVDLQPDVQGASALGHVAVVEQIFANGDVKASSMNWYPYPQEVTYQTFVPGPGVTFIHQ